MTSQIGIVFLDLLKAGNYSGTIGAIINTIDLIECNPAVGQDRFKTRSVVTYE